jgi:hypothetical protein
VPATSAGLLQIFVVRDKLTFNMGLFRFFE